MRLRKIWSRRQRRNPSAPLVMVRRIEGLSMHPALPVGTIVVGVRSLKKLKIGDIVIFDHGDLEKIKRVSSIDKNGVYLLGDNPNQSTDSRHFGSIELEKVKARVICRIPSYRFPKRAK